MRMREHLIEEDCLSRAWARAFLQVYDEGEIQPLIVTVTDLSHGRPSEDLGVRRALDRELARHGKQLCGTVANTLFPTSLWSRSSPRQELYNRYKRLVPRIKKRHPANRNGLYFERLISHGAGAVNQLEHVIQTWHGGNHRRSALIASVVDPAVDHTHQRQRGFPCLQQVAFTPVGKDGLAVSGFYVTQYVFERAYGNYLGLCLLGDFVASEMNRSLSRMTCFAAVAQRDATKRSTASFARQLRGMLAQRSAG